MYGLLLQNMVEYIVKVYGEEKWTEIKDHLKIKEETFSVKDTYPEGQLIKMGKKAMQVLGLKEEEFYEGMGMYFVALTLGLGYSPLLSHLGRELRDMLFNLDNLHEYLKVTFPRMKSPSFFVEEETAEYILIQYRSKRRGFHFYVQGQIKEVSKTFYNLKVNVQLEKQEVAFDTVVCTFKLFFPNSNAGKNPTMDDNLRENSLPIRAAMIFEMFPFCILFQKDLTVTSIGVALRQVMPGIIGKKITSYFELVKPLVEFRFDVIQSRRNNVFELATQEEIDKLGSSSKSSSTAKFDDEINLGEDVDKTLHIKGQMILVPEWNQLLFLACPVMKDLTSLMWTGLFVNDLSMHDYSRDIMLATTQEHIEIRMSLAAVESRSKEMALQMRRLDEVQKKTDELLYQMIPRSVAERLRKGENPMDTCEVFPSVTMLFSDIVSFTTICSRIQPAEVVMFLNTLYTLFDFLVDQNAVYKVETIGDAYLIVAGCPVKSTNHALKICDMAFDMMDGLRMLKDPGTGKEIQMRIGCHSGPVVAGIVGLKMPRYCLFGLNVGLTEKFESNSKPMRIHVSEPCKQLLPAQYKVEERNEPELAAKIGGLKSYFLNSKDGRKPLREDTIRALLPTESEAPKLDKKDPENKDESAALPEQVKGDGVPHPNSAREAPPPAPKQPTDINDNNNKSGPDANEEEDNEDQQENSDEARPNGPSQLDGKETRTASLLLEPTFPNGRRVSNVNTQCCNGFKKSGVCRIL